MRSIDVNGVNVEFPFTPYQCQLDFMAKVISSLQNRENALLESPTGTGKTLSLLCSCLGWMDNYKALAQFHSRNSVHEVQEKKKSLPEVAKLFDGVGSKHEDFINNRPPVIYYASRTHSQISQVVKELQSTAYKHVNSCVLGSREQMCIDSTVKKAASNSARTSMCRSLVSQKKCRYHSAIQSIKYNSDMYRHLDIEDLVSFGINHNACPYYLARELQPTADIVFLPYNYLIDPTSRRSQNIDVSNAILIFDEAHNLESICSEVSSFELTGTDIACAINEITYCKDLLSFSPTSISLEDLDSLSCLLLKYEERIMGIEFTEDSIVKPGQFIFDLFESIGITFNNAQVLVKMLEELCTILNGETAFFSKKNGVYLNKFLSAFRTLFHPDNKADLSSFCDNYKIYISKESSLANTKASQDNIWSKKTSKSGRSVSFWCFSSGVAMKSLVAQGCRSIILTSGTLSPLDSFAAEMCIPFPNMLENQHVIDSSQIFVGVVPFGPSGQPLNSSFKNRDVVSYKADLGNALVNFCRVIPDGILVFFPSYGSMEQSIDAWKAPNGIKNKSVWDRISQFKKPFIEPKDKSEFGKAMQTFYSKISDESVQGAIFFAVCRGKASEGIDFSDTRGRAVIITGIPYPAFKDARVMLKRKFLDDAHSKRSRLTKTVTISGETWYKQQAARAVNQAIGRVIRHRNDWGAVLLCDDRFSFASNQSQLPVWVRQYVHVFKNFGDAQGQLTRFMNRKTELDKENKAKQQVLVESVAEPRKQIGNTIENEVVLRKDVLKKDFNIAQEIRQSDEKKPKEAFSLISAVHKISSNIPKAITNQNEDTNARSAKEYLQQIKTSLSREDYKNFQKLLKSFKEKKLAISELCDAYEKIFANAQLSHLYRHLKQFLPSAHKPYFEERVNGFESKISLNAADSSLPAIKRQKIEDLEGDGIQVVVIPSDPISAENTTTTATSNHAECIRRRLHFRANNHGQLLNRFDGQIRGIKETYLKPISIPRTPDSEGNRIVRKFIIDHFTRLKWHVELDEFEDETPRGTKKFCNIIVTKGIGAPRRLVLAAHYDSKISPDGFIGASDSAGPIAIMLHIADSLNSELDKLNEQTRGLSVQMIFFDGEEAIVEWQGLDNTYGSRHLAANWSQMPPKYDKKRSGMFSIFDPVSMTDQIDLFILLDLIGYVNNDSGGYANGNWPAIPNYFPRESGWLFEELKSIENWLQDLQLLSSDRQQANRNYFIDLKQVSEVSDDHLPFRSLGIPVLHLIPSPFPATWHTLNDRVETISEGCLQDFSRILQVFIVAYLTDN